MADTRSHYKVGNRSIPKNIRAAVRHAVDQAQHLTEMDYAMVAVLFRLADQIEYLLDNNGLNAEGKFDNVSIPVFLKYCDALGLTVASRAAVAKNQGQPVVGKGTPGKLTGLKGGLGV